MPLSETTSVLLRLPLVFSPMLRLTTSRDASVDEGALTSWAISSA